MFPLFIWSCFIWLTSCSTPYRHRNLSRSTRKLGVGAMVPQMRKAAAFFSADVVSCDAPLSGASMFGMHA